MQAVNGTDIEKLRLPKKETVYYTERRIHGKKEDTVASGVRCGTPDHPAGRDGVPGDAGG